MVINQTLMILVNFLIDNFYVICLINYHLYKNLAKIFLKTGSLCKGGPYTPNFPVLTNYKERTSIILLKIEERERILLQLKQNLQDENLTLSEFEIVNEFF